MNVSVIGATGYTGFELVKILSRHPEFEISCLTSESYCGQRMSDVYPQLKGICDNVLVENDFEAVNASCDAVFLCLPHAASQKAAEFFYRNGKIVVDLSADFRLKDKELYESVYNVNHDFPELINEAVYGLCEIYADKIKDTRLVANPGCYPTSVIVPLYPLIKAGLVEACGIIADSKSGVTGAGRKATEKTHYCEVNEDFKPYGIFTHRHNPEINHILGFTGVETDVLFTPHLLPVNKGIETTIYAKSSVDASVLKKCLTDFYAGRKFVRIYDDNSVPSTKNVVNTNFIDINVFTDKGRVIIVSVIDNLIKGASGAAVQNLNIIAGLSEETGLL